MSNAEREPSLQEQIEAVETEINAIPVQLATTNAARALRAAARTLRELEEKHARGFAPWITCEVCKRAITPAQD